MLLMKNIKTLFIILLSTFLLFLLGCSREETKKKIELKNPKTIRLIGDIAGLNYTCSSGKSGVTNTRGEITCESGDFVTLSFRSNVLGKVSMRRNITPYTIFPDNEEAAINFERLMQTLDTDGNLSNGIELNSDLLVSSQEIDFISPSFKQT